MGNRYGLPEDQVIEESLGDFASLPPDCLYEILSYCDAASLAKISCLNHFFNEVASDNVITL